MSTERHHHISTAECLTFGAGTGALGGALVLAAALVAGLDTLTALRVGAYVCGACVGAALLAGRLA